MRRNYIRLISTLGAAAVCLPVARAHAQSNFDLPTSTMAPFRDVMEQYKSVDSSGQKPAWWAGGVWDKDSKGEFGLVSDPVEKKPAIVLKTTSGRPSAMWKMWKEQPLEAGRYEARFEYMTPGDKNGTFVYKVGATEKNQPLPASSGVWKSQAVTWEAPRKTDLLLTFQNYSGLGDTDALYIRNFALVKTSEATPPVPFKVDVSKVTGATVNEKSVQRTLEVGPRQQYKTLRAAWDAAMPLLREGMATRIRLQPGVYREGEFEIDANKLGGKASDTLFIIEAATPGSAIISGSDLYAPNTWKAVRDAAGKILYYEHAWTHNFGFRPGGWRRHNPRLTIEHRREQMFFNGQPLKQVELEIYKHTPVQPKPNDGWNSLNFPEGTKTDSFEGVPQDINSKGLYEYQRFQNPATALTPGTFGVAERDENGNKIFFRPPAGAAINNATLEVGVRQFHLWSFYKNNLVLRGLTFQHGAGEIEARGAVLVGHWLHTQGKFNNNNVLIEDCNFLWNNNNQLVIRYARDITLRRNKMLYGAYGGILTGGLIHNMLWEDNDTSFNNWRVSGGWASGPVKVHNTVDAIFRRHTSVGNFGTGMWYDVTCSNVLVEDARLLHNTTGFDWEISQGFLFRRGLVANNNDNFWMPTGSDVVVEDSILYGAKKEQIAFEAGRRDSGQEVNELLGRPIVDKYELGPLTLRNSVIGSYDDAPLFFQRHGNPGWYQEFLRERVKSENNVWFAAAPKVFGLVRDYSPTHQGRIVNAMTDFEGWRKITGDTTSAWADPMFQDPRNGDFRLKPGSPLQKNRNLPTIRFNAGKLQQLQQFLARGLHVKENAQDVENVAVD